MHSRDCFQLLALPLAASLLLAAGAKARAEDPKPYSLALEESSPESVAKALDDSWPDRPEWVDMLADILQGSQLGPEDGWFRRAVAQTRFDWASTRQRYDRDGDGLVSREEFPGADEDFARLDRDRDQSLNEADFDFSAHALTPTPGAMLFLRADGDGNGKVTKEELETLFEQCDSGGQGFLSLDEMQGLFRSPPRPPSASKPSGGPSKETLVRGLFRQEIGSLQPGPALDEEAPDFTLRTNDLRQEITLSRLIGPKPVVLVFGNITCGPFRSQAGNIEKLFERYKDRATLVMVYVREAHPADGWSSENNFRLGITLSQPQTFEERLAAAQSCGKRLSLGFPMLVDTIDDEVGARYSGMPSRLYLIDKDGKVAYKSGRGPFGFKPAELEQSLVLLLTETADAGSPASGRESASVEKNPSSTDADQ